MHQKTHFIPYHSIPFPFAFCLVESEINSTANALNTTSAIHPESYVCI